MKSLYTLVILCVFFTSCKKDDVKPETFLTLSITNNSEATLKHIYTKFKYESDVVSEVSGDILPAEVKPGESTIIKRDTKFTNSVVLSFEGDYEKIDFTFEVADEGGTMINNDHDGYTLLDVFRAKQGEQISVEIQ